MSYLIFIIILSQIYYFGIQIIIAMDDDNMKPSFRNTRSKFFEKKKSQFNNSSNQSQSEENTGDFWKKKGNKYLAQGSIHEAIDCYTKAISINSGESIYYSNRARCYKKIDRIKQALSDAQQACELDEMNIKAHYICGCLQAELAKKDHTKLGKAINRLKKALRLCSTLKKQQFIDQISIKLFRVRKLQYFIEQENKRQFLSQQKQVIEDMIKSKIISQIKATKMLANLTLANKQLDKQKQIPNFMLCKITLQIMQDPVTTEAGFTFQRSAIQDHFQTNGTVDPLSRNTISPKLYPNQALKAAIHSFLEEHPWAFQFTPHQKYMQIIF